MSKKKKGNSYAKKAAKAGVMGNMTHTLATKGDVKNSLLETGKDILIGVVGGGLIGAAVGKPSLIIGVGVTGAGHYMENRMVTLLGIGMMAANGFQKSKTVEGLDGMNMQSIKDRMNAYKDNFAEKLYLDKVLHKSKGGKDKEETSGFGELQFFNYPNDVNGPYNEYSALDSIERQIEESGMAHMQMTGIGMGDMQEMGEVGNLGEMGELSLVDASDYNL
jgi:hypothetical protein